MCLLCQILGNILTALPPVERGLFDIVTFIIALFYIILHRSIMHETSQKSLLGIYKIIVKNKFILQYIFAISVRN